MTKFKKYYLWTVYLHDFGLLIITRNILSKSVIN